MTELEELLKQKKEIENKIKSLKGEGIFSTNARYGIEHYTYYDRYYIAVKYKDIDTESYIWRHIINKRNKEELLSVAVKLLALAMGI